jgi:hypothetical protein
MQRKQNFSDRLSLDAYRLSLATGSMSAPADYMEMAQLALQADLASEGKQVIDKGMSSGALSTGAQADRAKRLKALIDKKLAEEAASRAEDERQAAAAKSGDAMVSLGMSLVYAGQAPKGVQMMQQGIAKGGLKRPEDAKLHLGIAQLVAGDKAKAQATFKTVQGADGTADLARLWALYARRGARSRRRDAALRKAAPKGPAPPSRREGSEAGREQPCPAPPARSSRAYLGARRIAPSRRITSPFSMSLVTIWCTSLAKSAGVPRRLGKGTLAASACCTSSGIVKSIGVPKMPGRDRHVADAALGEVARDRQGHADDAALRRRIGGLADLAVVGGDARRRDQHAALAGRFGLVLAHGLGGEADHVEAADEVDRDHPAEQRQGVRALLADRPRRRADAGAIDEAEELAGPGRLGDHALAVGFLADVAADEAAADLGGDAAPRSSCRSATTTVAPGIGKHARRAFAEPEAPPVTMNTLPLISMSSPQASAARARAVISSTLPVPLIFR